MTQDPYKYFRLEARELLDQFGASILALEKPGGNGDQTRQLLRLAHTLKGAARVVRQPEIATHAHEIEGLLAPFRGATDQVPNECVSEILRHLDGIEGRVRALAATGGAARSEPAPEESLRTVRVDLAEMDAFLDGVSETHALLGELRPAVRAVERARHLADLLVGQLTPRGTTVDGRRLQIDPEHALLMVDELRGSFDGLERRLGSAVDHMERELHQLRDSAEQLRLMPAGALFTLLERTVRDAGQALGKLVVFEGNGGEIRLDAHVLGTMQAALVQIIRNAVAHGIESESERRTIGKPPTGRVTIEVSRRGRRILFVCRDDGRGIDIESVRRIARDRGLLSAEVKASSEEELVHLLLRGGISTSESVTEIAGRGIGLDVVRQAIGRLGGDAAVRTEPGKGTSFELTVPLLLASMDVLLMEAGGTSVAIPLDAVRSSMRVAAGEIARGAQGASVVHGKTAVPFMALPMVLNGTRSPADRTWPVVIVAGAGGVAAIGVERLLGTARVVVRPLPDQAPASAIVAGVSLDAGGNPQLVLDPDALVTRARSGDAPDIEPTAPAQPVLVVDDSLTTRMLEQSILESAGYAVDVATSAEQALESAARKRYSLFLVDVEMPGMDGFGFVERIRSDPNLRDIPAILVTSRSAPEDRQRGRDAGAHGYIVKSEFDQAALLATIKSLIGQ